MSEKPQETRTDEQVDLLEQIITQGLDQMKAPEQTESGEEAPVGETSPAPTQEDSGEDAAPAEKKNRRSAVYLYLLILFGAAFFMLLLAYFIQQRSNETTISDLRDMTLSRDELLAEIKDLEEQNAALEEQNAALNDGFGRVYNDLIQLQKQYEEKEQEADDLWEQYNTALAQLSGWKNSWALEQSYQAEDYEDCVAILFLENMSEFGSTVPQEALERRQEIIQALADRGLLPEDHAIRISDYEELIDRYLADHPDYHGPTGWANIIYD